MTTIADALEIMTVIAACHHRTAPRTDDHEAAIATAKIWAELLDPYQLPQTDLIAAIKQRARACADAPEPSDIIRIARQIRGDRTTNPDPDEPTREDLYQRRSEDKAAPDPAPYPEDWTPEQRVSAYWYTLARGITVQTDTGWNAVLTQIEREHQRHHDLCKTEAPQ